jgi:hypothetical protein
MKTRVGTAVAALVGAALVSVAASAPSTGQAAWTTPSADGPASVGSPSAGPASVGVVCRNNSGDAETIQAAINGTQPGDEVVFDGPCLIDRTISLLGDRSYRGAGEGTILTAAPGSGLRAVLASDSWVDDRTSTGHPFSLRDLTVDGNRAQNGSGGDGIVIRSWRTTLDGVTVRGAGVNGIRITSVSRNGVRLSGTQVNGTLRNLFVTGSGQHGIYIEDPGNAVTDWHLLDSWIAASGATGIRAENSAGWTVRGNHLYGNGAAGMNLDRLFATSVVENYVEDFTTEGIRVTVQGDAASVVSGNRLFQFSRGGNTFLHVARVNYGTGHLAVTGNVIRGSGAGTGMLFEAGAHRLTVVSTGNDVSDVAIPRRVAPGVVLSSGI